MKSKIHMEIDNIIISEYNNTIYCFFTERAENRELMRSTSTLPVPHPGSHPPTPIHLLTGGSDTEEERGDLIMFYNQV